MKDLEPSALNWLAVIGLCAACLTMLTLGGHVLGSHLREMMDLPDGSVETLTQDGVMTLMLLIYVVMIALPFVPGAEFGLALLIVFGAQVAGALYIATVVALTLSFCVGRLVPASSLRSILARFRFTRASLLLSDTRPSALEGGLSIVEGRRLPYWMNWYIRHRMWTLAILIATPGNSLIGGGGGIALAAGVGRLVTFREFLISASCSVAPVPALVTVAAWF